jgi:hypothetical protein
VVWVRGVVALSCVALHTDTHAQGASGEKSAKGADRFKVLRTRLPKWFCCVMLRCAALHRVVLCCALCCVAVLCCAVLWCVASLLSFLSLSRVLSRCVTQTHTHTQTLRARTGRSLPRVPTASRCCVPDSRRYVALRRGVALCSVALPCVFVVIFANTVVQFALPRSEFSHSSPGRVESGVGCLGKNQGQCE